MKKLNVFLGLSVLSMALFFTACSDEDAIGPSLQITSGEVDTVAANGTVTVTWRADAGDANLKSFTITNELGSAIAGWDAIDIPTANNETYIGTADIPVGDEDTYFNLVVTDNDGLDATAKITIVIAVDAGTPLKTFTTVLLGAQDNADEPSCASLETGLTYAISGSEAKNNSAEVDIVHYNGASGVALYAPSNSNIQGVVDFAIGTWDTKNATKLLISTLNSEDFDNITTDLDLVGLSTPSADILAELTTGKVVIFETAGGKKGVFEVTDIVDAADGSITISVKVEE